MIIEVMISHPTEFQTLDSHTCGPILTVLFFQLKLICKSFVFLLSHHVIHMRNLGKLKVIGEKFSLKTCVFTKDSLELPKREKTFPSSGIQLPVSFFVVD